MCESTARLVPLEEIPDSLVIFRTHAINVSLQGLTIITGGGTVTGSPTMKLSGKGAGRGKNP